MTSSGERIASFAPCGAMMRITCALVAICTILISFDAYCAHPLITEDTATQGAGKSELEVANSWTRDPSGNETEFGVQYSYGITENVDLIARPTFLFVPGNDEGTARTRGFGDTTLAIKWHFFDADAASLAVRAGITAPTAARGL